LCAYELKYKISEDDEMYAYLIDGHLKLPKTAAVMQRLTDAQIMKLVMLPITLGFAH
jgi:hypothetical protein